MDRTVPGITYCVHTAQPWREFRSCESQDNIQHAFPFTNSRAANKRNHGLRRHSFFLWIRNTQGLRQDPSEGRKSVYFWHSFSKSGYLTEYTQSLLGNSAGNTALSLAENYASKQGYEPCCTKKASEHSPRFGNKKVNGQWPFWGGYAVC